MKTKVFWYCFCLRLGRKLKINVKRLWMYEFLSFLLLKNQSHWASFGWQQTHSTNKCHMLQSYPRNKPPLKSKVIHPALPQHWALPACRVVPLMHSGVLTQETKEVLTARNSIALTYRHFLHPSEGLVLSRSVDRYLQPRLHIAIQALGWVFPWIHSDSQVPWELHRARGSGVVITIFPANPKGGLSKRQNHSLFSSVQQR